MNSQWDAVIVSEGAAGLTAGIVLARDQSKTLVIDNGEPRNAPAAHMHGYLSRDGMAPAGFLETGKNEFTGYGGTLTRCVAAIAITGWLLEQGLAAAAGNWSAGVGGARR